MSEPLISLVIATVGRSEPLRPLLTSLAAQQGVPFEVILVDQNADDRLVPLVAEFATRLTLRHVRAERRNSSFARNAGLPHCRGALIGFPDDDCLYPPGALSVVAAAFAADPALDVLTGPAASPAGGLGSGRWLATPAAITRANVFITVICFNLFLRRAVLHAIGGFDEALGVGAEFGSCEENDLVIRALAAGYGGRYYPGLRIVHPDKRLSIVARDRAFRYGAGLGYVLRKHRFGLPAIGTFLVRSLGGTIFALCRADVLAASYYWQTFRGRLFGYRAAAGA
jgi:glycosyltransferase involved in cell wall biosynthesis